MVLPGLPSLPVPVWQDSTRSWGISCISTILLPAAPRRNEGHFGSWLRPRLASSSSADGSEQGNSSCLSLEAAQSLGSSLPFSLLTASSLLTRAGPDPPAPAELAKAVSSEGRRFGSAALLSKDLLFPKQLLLAGMSMGISWLVTPQPARLALSVPGPPSHSPPSSLVTSCPLSIPHSDWPPVSPAPAAQVLEGAGAQFLAAPEHRHCC